MTSIFILNSVNQAQIQEMWTGRGHNTLALYCHNPTEMLQWCSGASMVTVGNTSSQWNAGDSTEVRNIIGYILDPQHHRLLVNIDKKTLLKRQKFSCPTPFWRRKKKILEEIKLEIIKCDFFSFLSYSLFFKKKWNRMERWRL